jgi:hypothetical protein
MVMIVKDHEKKAVGFISVTQITARVHVSALSGPYAVSDRSCLWSPRSWAGPRLPLRALRLSPWNEDAGRRHGGTNDA